ncbi:EAL domain-containing protein [Deinococcus sp. HMF7604]|uniref:EAL domain-containing protein n=1 Tax=Deinococcus betulae TaxID=2873312 RepID=UPI001CCCE0C5|nr:EAL domain-containing protein [Deinococcus betulae]MBZ9749891.1 EAL domain-containing protein [Deinococcus betulae]
MRSVLPPHSAPSFQVQRDLPSSCRDPVEQQPTAQSCSSPDQILPEASLLPTRPPPTCSSDLLSGALRRGEFRVHYQPIVSAVSGQPIKAEALLRWQPAGQPLVSPSDFLAQLEASDEMADVGTWVLWQACHAAARWPGTRIAVNLSEAQFSRRNFVTTVKQVLRDTGLQPNCLELELTETMLMTGSCYAARALRRLRAFGVRVVLDDFGTGFSNLSCLQFFPFDGLKLDRSLVQPLQRRDARSLTIVRGLVELCQRLQLEITAEGVETPVQLRTLQAMDVPLLQGYLFARPQESWAPGTTKLAGGLEPVKWSSHS